MLYDIFIELKEFLADGQLVYYARQLSCGWEYSGFVVYEHRARPVPGKTGIISSQSDSRNAVYRFSCFLFHLGLLSSSIHWICSEVFGVERLFLASTMSIDL